MIKKNDKKSIKKAIKSVTSKYEDQNEEKKEKDIQLLTFELDQEEYGVEVEGLREIIPLSEVTDIPGSPDFVKGILNLRGKIIVVIDLEKRFKLKRENEIKSRHIIITEVDGSNFGVIVDKVTEVIKVPLSSIRKTPSLVNSKINTSYLSGVVVLENKEEKSTKQKLTSNISKTQAKSITKKQKNKILSGDSRLIILLKLQKMLEQKELSYIESEVAKASKK